MNKTTKISWGAATLLPIFLTILGVFFFIFSFIPMIKMQGKQMAPDQAVLFMKTFFGFYILIIGSLVLAFLVKISYFVHLVRNDTLGSNEKTVWVCTFLVFHTLAMFVYWCMRVWPDPSPLPRGRKSPRRSSKVVSG